jgi:hypothetical protein
MRAAWGAKDFVDQVLSIWPEVFERRNKPTSRERIPIGTLEIAHPSIDHLWLYAAKRWNSTAAAGRPLE